MEVRLKECPTNIGWWVPTTRKSTGDGSPDSVSRGSPGLLEGRGYGERRGNGKSSTHRSLLRRRSGFHDVRQNIKLLRWKQFEISLMGYIPTVDKGHPD